MAGRVKLTDAQVDALGWLNHDGSYRTWGGKDCGHPAIAALEALVRKDFATKKGGDGFPARYAVTPTGRRHHANRASGKGE